MDGIVFLIGIPTCLWT